MEQGRYDIKVDNTEEQLNNKPIQNQCNSSVETKESRFNKNRKKLVFLLGGGVVVIGVILLFFVFWHNNVISEDFEELKNFTRVEKWGIASTYTNEAVDKYVKWSYGDEWYFVEQEPYSDNEKSLKFARANGDFFHAIVGFSNGTKAVNGGILPDDSYYSKTYQDTYEYEILKCHDSEITRLAKRLSLNADVVIENRNPATNAYIILNDIDLETDSEKIADFMVEASEIVNYDINPDMQKIKIGLNVTVNLTGGDDEPSLTLAKNQDERNEHDSDYYLKELESQISKNNN